MPSGRSKLNERIGQKKEIDCRGMACPQPVVTTKQVMDQLKENALTIIVDNPASSQEVDRFARSQGCSVRIEKKGKDFYVHIQKGDGKDEKAERKLVTWQPKHHGLKNTVSPVVSRKSGAALFIPISIPASQEKQDQTNKEDERQYFLCWGFFYQSSDPQSK